MSDERWEVSYRGTCDLRTSGVRGGLLGSFARLFTAAFPATLFLNTDGVHVKVSPGKSLLIGSSEFRASLVDGTCSFPWPTVTSAEFDRGSVVFGLGGQGDLRFRMSPADLRAAQGVLEESGVNLPDGGLTNLGRDQP